MSDRSAIEWTDATWNPIGGCSIKSPGCAPCYAQKLAGTRLKNHPLYAGTTTAVKGKSVFNGKLTILPDEHDAWSWPIKWKGAATPKLGAGNPSLIFVGDMSDLFHEDRPSSHIDKVIGVAGAVEDAGRTHILQLLTKRPDRMLEYIRASGHRAWNARRLGTERWPAPNLWLGMSAERQPEFDERWPHLRELARMGFVVFVSYEPAIGPLKLPADFLALGERAQVIAGGMSGADATPPHPDWFRGPRDQCAVAGVPFFFKQWGEYLPASYIPVGDIPNGCFIVKMSEMAVCRVGKKRAGRLLDGVEHNEFPRVQR